MTKSRLFQIKKGFGISRCTFPTKLTGSPRGSRKKKTAKRHASRDCFLARERENNPPLESKVRWGDFRWKKRRERRKKEENKKSQAPAYGKTPRKKNPLTRMRVPVIKR